MPITERTLKRWRGDALELKELRISSSDEVNVLGHTVIQELVDRVLRTTSELLDLELLKKRKL